jgi:tetratricopeptide (TPR) repeat protein
LYDDSIKGFTQSTLIKSNYADAYHNRANILFKIGRLDLARDSYETALYYSPQLYQTYLSLTQIDLMQNNLQLAYTDASKAVQIDPTNVQSEYVLAVVYAQAGQLNQASDILENILKSNPGYQPAVAALAQIKLQMAK